MFDNMEAAVSNTEEQISVKPLQFQQFLHIKNRNIFCEKAEASSLTEQQLKLLRRALHLWNLADKFSDADVSSVKDLTRNLFGLSPGKEIKGFVTQDSISFVDKGAGQQWHIVFCNDVPWPSLYRISGEFETSTTCFKDVLETLALF